MRKYSCANSSFGLKQAPVFTDNVHFITESSLMSIYSPTASQTALFIHIIYNSHANCSQDTGDSDDSPQYRGGDHYTSDHIGRSV